MTVSKKALFLDRDGVINVDHGYVHQVEEFEFMPGIFALCRRFQAEGYAIFVITNQTGIGRGFYQESDFNTLTQWMLAQFKQKGITISAVYHCPHHPTEALGDFLKHCECRKPQPGMILQAATEWLLDLEQSVFIGDKQSDMQAAANAGVGRKVLLSSRYHDNQDRQQVELVGKLDDIQTT